MENNQAKTERQDSDFKALHYALQEAISTNIELVEKVGYYSNQLKEVEPMIVKAVPTDDEPTKSVVNLMWSEIDKIRFINDKLNHYTNHLQSVIGDKQ
jgi:hypothetical protein